MQVSFFKGVRVLPTYKKILYVIPEANQVIFMRYQLLSNIKFSEKYFLPIETCVILRTY